MATTHQSCMKMQENTKEIPKFRKALPQILAIAVKNVLLFGFGMTLGFPTILIPKLSGGDPNESIVFDQESISWIGSANYLCVPLGCLLSGAITQPFGRRRAMQIVNIPFLTAWLLFYFATEKWHLFFALCMTGAAGGLLEAPTLTYLSEVTTPNLRGVLASSTTVSVIAGTLLIIVMGSVAHWKTVAAMSCVMPVISAILLFFVPESPHWLISKNRLDDAQKSIAWLRGWVPLENVQCELEDLCEQIRSTARVAESSFDDSFSGKISRFKETAALYLRKDFLWPFGLIALTFFLGHFSGMTTLLTYAVNIFATLGSPIDKYYATITLSIAQVIGCILSSSLVHFTGKRKVNFFSLIGCGICFAVVAAYSYHIGVRYLEMGSQDIDVLSKYSWIPMTFLIGAALFAAVGIRILPWMLIGEIYHHEIRALASGFSAGMGYIIGFFANKTFFTLISLLTLQGTFVFYSAMAFAGFIILYFWLPETERKTLYEISQHFAGKEKLSNQLKKNCAEGKENRAFEKDTVNKFEA